MGRRCVWLLLVSLGSALLIVAVFPIFEYLRLEEPWQTALVASKLIMLPAGVICFVGATALKLRKAIQ